MGAMKKLAEEFILEAEETGTDVKELIADFAREWEIDGSKIYAAVQKLQEEDERKGEMIDRLLL